MIHRDKQDESSYNQIETKMNDVNKQDNQGKLKNNI